MPPSELFTDLPSVKVRLQGGRCVDISTQRGADLYIGDGTRPIFEKDIVERANRLRAELNSLNSLLQLAMGREIFAVYRKAFALFEVASKDAVAKIPFSQYVHMVEHFNEVFAQLTNSPKWQLTGAIDKWDHVLLCNFIRHARHTSMAQAMEDRAMPATLNAFIEACQVTPSFEVANTVIGIIANFMLQWYKLNTCRHDASKRLIRTGMFTCYLRCLVQPS